LSDDDEEHEDAKGESSAEEGKASEMEEEREVRLDEEERRKGSAVICTQTGYAFMDERRKRSDKLTRGDDKWACLGEVVLEVSMTASNKDK